MKPRNRFQKQVAELSKQLRHHYRDATSLSFRYCFKHYAIKRADGTNTCTECGHSWKSDGIIITFKDWQVLCFFYMQSYQKKGGFVYFYQPLFCLFLCTYAANQNYLRTYFQFGTYLILCR